MKDYAKKSSAPNKRRRKSSRGRKKLWLLFFLLAGAFAYGLFYLHKYFPEIKTEVTETLAKRHHLFPKKKSIVSAPKQEVKKEVEFDFYTLLPKGKVPPKPAQYQLEIVNTSDFNTVDETKASLALLGFEVTINSVKKENKIWYKVLTGPYSDQKSALAAKNLLLQNKITAKLLTITPEPSLLTSKNKT
jgi:hypothetical protein